MAAADDESSDADFLAGSIQGDADDSEANSFRCIGMASLSVHPNFDYVSNAM